MENQFRKVAEISLILVYLVILAGAIVRMTGSGMGCPDWPKCFGQYIPPTSISEVQWQKNRSIKKGQIIIVEEALQVAKKDFTTTTEFDKNNWNPYTEHDYAAFNAVRTWIEYINRLVTVVLGIPMLLLLGLSFRFFKKDKLVSIITITTFIILGVQAILGKIVVDTQLKPTMISVHMIIALLIMLLLIYLIFRTSKQIKKQLFDKTLLTLLYLSFVATFAQIVMGIGVRQFIDNQVLLLGESANNLWLENPTIQFYLHRSFSIAVFALNIVIAFRIHKLKLGYSQIRWVIILIFAEVFTGIAMNYFNFPFASQPLHLLLASLILGAQFYLILEAQNSRKSLKTL